MKTKILLAAVAGALVLPAPMASQADVMSGMDFKISGRVAAGITRADTDAAGESATWDLGTTTGGTGKDTGIRTDSRITFSADRDTDFGTAGFRLERDWTLEGLNDNRHQYVYFGGDWGTLYVGNHGNPVGMGNGYDQSFFFGGGGRINGTDRHDGIGYAYSNGAFSLGVTLHGANGTRSTRDMTAKLGNDAAGRSAARAQLIAMRDGDGFDNGEKPILLDADSTATGSQAISDTAARAARPTPATAGMPTAAETALIAAWDEVEARRVAYNNAIDANNAEFRKTDETIDTTIIGASYDLGIGVKIGASYYKDNTETGHDSTSVMVSGAFNQFSYWVMYETASDATPNGNNDIDGIGVHLQYALSDADNVWFQYGSRDYDVDGGTGSQCNTSAGQADCTDIVVGYSHSFGGGATGVVEYRTRDVDDVGGATNPDPSILHIGVRVAF